jgi:hypothetical protein
VLVVYDREAFLWIPFDRTVIDPTTPEGQEGGRVLTFDVVDEGTFPFKLRDRETGTLWSLTGQALEGPMAGAALQSIAGSFAAFWFAWASFNQGTEIYQP